MQNKNLLSLLKERGKPLAIIGSAGSGKSTIGKRLAKKLGIQVYDTDSRVEYYLGHTKVDIYDFQGKDFFKKKEKEVVKEILSYGMMIMSTGSETYLDEELRQIIDEKCITIWLKADVETLYSRIIRRNTRPEIDRVEDKKAALKEMIEKSYPMYEKADIIVTSQNMEPHYVIDTIIAKLTTLLESKKF